MKKTCLNLELEAEFHKPLDAGTARQEIIMKGSSPIQNRHEALYCCTIST